jgi:hypothetical protein
VGEKPRTREDGALDWLMRGPREEQVARWTQVQYEDEGKKGDGHL